jgi:ATP-dependent DNA helicase RecG
MFTSCKVESIENKQVISIIVQRGTNSPYYIADKGLKPAGVYIRQGTASAPASENAIRQMIKETDGDKFEEIRSFNQELTFEELEEQLINWNKNNPAALGHDKDVFLTTYIDAEGYDFDDSEFS